MGLSPQTPCAEQSAIGESMIKNADAFLSQQRVCNLSHTVGTQWQLQRRQDEVSAAWHCARKGTGAPIWTLLSGFPAQSSHYVTSLILK